MKESRKKINILHVTERLITGGAEKLLVDLVAHHDPERFRLGVLCVQPGDSTTIFAEELDKWKNIVEVFNLDKEYKGLGLIKMQYKIIKIIRAFKPDIIHTHMNGIIYAILPTLLSGVTHRLQTVHLDAVNEAFVIGEKMQLVSTVIYKLLKYTAGKAAGRIRLIENDKEDRYKEYNILRFVKGSRVYKSFDPGSFFDQACLGSRLLETVYKKLRYTPVAISGSVKHSLESIYDLKDLPMIHNGIDTRGFSAAGGKSRRGNGESIQIVHIGRFQVSKNHELLVDAFALLLKKCPRLKMVLVGEGAYRARVMKEVVKSGLSDYIDFLGVRKDIRDILAGSDILVLSSITEGFGLVLVEAMSMGLPVAATNVGGIKEIVQDGVNGILVEPNDPGLLAQAMEKLVKNKELREQMGRKGIEMAGRFDIRRTVEEYQELYVRMVSRRHQVER